MPAASTSRIPKRLVAAVAAVAALLSVPAAALACGAPGYTYAGVSALRTGYGISSHITAVNDPLVQFGHVAGWIGVGGPKQGPNGTDEWIQVGFSAFPGSPNSNLYYEVAHPGHGSVYHELATALPTGLTRRVAVLEMSHRRNWWRVWVNGTAVGQPIHLPGSHGAWRPMATAESWGGDSRACNVYRYRFNSVSIAAAPGGSWRSLSSSYSFHSPDYAVVRASKASFIATASDSAFSEARALAALATPAATPAAAPAATPTP